MPSDSDNNLKHLEAEFTRVDLLLHRAIRLWRKAGQDASDDFRGLYITDAEADALLRRPLSTSWGQSVELPRGDAHAYERAMEKAEADIRSVVEAAARGGQDLRLARLAAGFALDRFDLDLLLICLAPAIDLRYERLFGYLQDDITRRRPGVNLVLDLLSEPGPGRLNMLARFSDEAPLFKYEILERIDEPGAARSSWLNQSLAVDRAVVAWLLGHYEPQSDLALHAKLSHGAPDPSDDVVAAPFLKLIEDAAGSTALVAFHGRDQEAQIAAARLLAARAGRPLLTVEMQAVIQDGLPPWRALRLALRDARLTRAIPCLLGWDALVSEGSLPGPLTAELFAHPGMAVVASRSRWQPTGVSRERHLLWAEFPVPVFAQRRELWLHAVGRPEQETELDVPSLAGQFLLTSAQIRDAVATARDIASQRGAPLQAQDLFTAARIHSSSGLSSLARKIRPRYGWDDIILPVDQISILREIVATVRGRPIVLDEWGIGKKLASSNGVTVLFAGPPGTGKTMGAEVIAAELRLDLFKIDLSTVVSKYIGETEKNLEKIFEAAETSNAILFFDEADAIFGKRSEVQDSHDRYANIEISYLLQRMEAYDGVTILATNLRANLDEAFTRRLQFAVDYPFPEEADRLRIWQTLFPRDVPHRPDLDLPLLARRFKLAGGSIRNVIVNAAFLAATDGGEITMHHLLHGTRREMQKMGRLMRENDLTLTPNLAPADDPEANGGRSR